MSVLASIVVAGVKDGREHDLTRLVSRQVPNPYRDQVIGEVAAAVRADENFVLLSGSEFIWRPGWVQEERARRKARDCATLG